MRKFPKSRLICRIDMSAFLAIMFALVFMWMGTDITNRHIRSVDLPFAEHPAPQPRADREDAMFITVTRDGSIFFDQDKVRSTDLHNLVRDRLIQGAEPKIYFKVDAHAQYGAAVEALDGIRSNGVRDIAFIVEDQHEIEARR